MQEKSYFREGTPFLVKLGGKAYDLNCREDLNEAIGHLDPDLLAELAQVITEFRFWAEFDRSEEGLDEITRRAELRRVALS